MDPAGKKESEMKSDSAHAIMLVDDEENILKLLKIILSPECSRILTARSGEEALDLLQAHRHPISLIIADQRMPGMDGIGFFEQSMQYCPDAMRFLITGYHNVDVMMEAVNRCKIHHYLRKPWNDQSLKIEVRHALEQHDLIRSNRHLKEELHRKNERLRQANADLEQMVEDRMQRLRCHGQSLELQHAILDVLPVAVMAVDSGMNIVMANRAAHRIITPFARLDAGVCVISCLGEDIAADLSTCFDATEIRRFAAGSFDSMPFDMEVIPLTGRFRGKAVIIKMGAGSLSTPCGKKDVQHARRS